MVEMESVAITLDRGEAIARLHADSDLAEELRGLFKDGVGLKPCDDAARHPSVSREELLSGVEVVSSGVGERTRLYGAGYAYVRL